MNLLLTGSSGFLGKAVFNQMVNHFVVFGLSRNNSKYALDLESDTPKFHDVFSLVIHAAGKAHSKSITDLDKREFYEVNVLGTINLLNGLEKSGIPNFFVFISSVSVYGRDFGSLLSESTHLGAVDAYGASKIEAEKIILNWCTKHNVVCTILRLPLLVGANPPGNLGAMIKGIIGGYYFNVGGGKAKRSMVLVDDISKAILNVYKIGGIYNLTDGYHPSFLELSKNIALKFNKGAPMNIPFFLAFFLAKIGDFMFGLVPFDTNRLKKITKDLTFDDSKARNAFGWDPTPVLEFFKIN